MCWWGCFNPRTREGCDELSHGNHRATGGFNPRTREGCDPPGPGAAPPLGGFNPRTREGCDPVAIDVGVGQQEFQSTHPRGVRPDYAALRAKNVDVSIHAPARGATFAHRGFQPRGGVSIHAPARGTTLAYAFSKSVEYVSIHAPARGATLNFRRISFKAAFQSTHPRGVRRSTPTAPASTAGFNPRTREGCDGNR